VAPGRPSRRPGRPNQRPGPPIRSPGWSRRPVCCCRHHPGAPRSSCYMPGSPRSALSASSWAGLNSFRRQAIASTMLAAEQAGAGLARGLEARLDRAHLARRFGVVRLELEDLLEVAQGLLVAAEHALDAAKVEARALGATRPVRRALEDLAGLAADRGL